MGRIAARIGPEATRAAHQALAETVVRDSDRWIGGREPMGLVEFWHAVDGRAMRPKQLQFFTEAGILHARDLIDPNRQISLIVLALGKGSGKDLMVSRLFAWATYVLLHVKGGAANLLGLGGEDIVYFVNVATDQTQAKTVFFEGYLAPCFRHQLFAPWRPEVLSEEIRFGKDRIWLLSKPCTASGIEGLNPFMVVMDECDRYVMTETTDRAAELYNVFEASGDTRFHTIKPIIVLIGYIWVEEGFMDTQVKALQRSRPSHAYVAVAKTWEVRPEIRRESLQKHYDRDYRSARAMYECLPHAVIDAFLEFPERLLECTDFGRPPICQVTQSDKIITLQNGTEAHFAAFDVHDIRPQPGCVYFIGGDAGAKHDAFALTVWHVDQSDSIKPWLCPECGGAGDGGDYDEQVAMRTIADYARQPQGSQDSDARCGCCGQETSPSPWAPLTVRHDTSGWWRLVKSGVSRITGPRIFEDLLLRVEPRQPTGPGSYPVTVDFDSAKEVVVKLCRALNPFQVRFDPWQTVSITQDALGRTGCDVAEISFSNPDQVRRAVLYRALLNNHALSLLPNDVRDHEWKRLQLIRGTRVDHPTGGSKDFVDCEAICTFLAATFLGEFAELTSLESERPSMELAEPS